MYKNLAPRALGITCSQSELIELTLTHGFHGFELDLVAFQKQVDAHGIEHAARFVTSAPVKVTGGELPVRWWEDDATFLSGMKRMPAFLATAQAIGCEILETVVRPGSQARPYHENFELHRQRLSELAEALDQFGMRLGIAFQAAAADRQGYAYSFISTPDALLTLLKTTVAANLGVVVDSWQWTLGGGTFDQLRDLTATQITEVRLADLPPDVTSETARNEQRLLPGTTGRVDTVSLLRMLGQMGYTGPLTPYPHAAQFAGKKREETVHLAGASLDRQLALAGVAVGRPAPLHVGVLR